MGYASYDCGAIPQAARRLSVRYCRHVSLRIRCSCTAWTRTRRIHMSSTLLPHTCVHIHADGAVNVTREANRGRWCDPEEYQWCSHLAAPARTMSVTSRQACKTTRAISRPASNVSRRVVCGVDRRCHTALSSCAASMSPPMPLLRFCQCAPTCLWFLCPSFRLATASSV